MEGIKLYLSIALHIVLCAIYLPFAVMAILWGTLALLVQKILCLKGEEYDSESYEVELINLVDRFL